MRELDAAAVGRWASACAHSLDALRPEINGINVYPVADSDTGSNMHHTISGAWHTLHGEAAPATAGAALAALARGAVAAAKGNSGVILSQVLRGLAEALADRPVDGPALAEALQHADEVATGAVARPVAGTMLSVLHAVAGAVAGSADELAEVARVAAEAAAAALEQTPQQLPVLARAGVVDAGGRGVVAVLDALLDVITGDEHAHHHPLVAHSHGEPALYAWEVMFLLEGADETALPVLRKALSGLGDSVTVAADGAGAHAVHVHCADIGAAIEAALDAGRPRRIRVEPLVTPAPLEPGGGLDRTVVAVVHGEGLAEVIRAENIEVLSVPAGATPSVEEMLGLITETTGNHVTVLPGGPELTTAADTAAGHAMAGDRDVVVIPCASPVQVLAALAVHDPARRTNDDVVAMAEAAAATRRGEVLVAGGEALSVVGRAQAGDVLGLVDGEVVRIEPAPAAEANLLEAAITVLARLLGPGGELVTVLTGVGAPAGIEEVLTDWLRGEHPEVELVCYSGRQTDAVLLIGVE
ncbi:DAK2 domain-containing protein [Amycolatopsis sp. 195334CR]|uniref:DAK2 domain-containing protein n=1 Tax=Amycolatopsis sp. 195334CR TaxID=2814588 RepID=UPI001A8C17C2|nr:DAK2 domain-containing protein [Amycolatopsis sp. 195334CR]MBN6033592.1 DAK2 domain-containing protein [Amycolatopsis sp. 195334CR]